MTVEEVKPPSEGERVVAGPHLVAIVAQKLRGVVTRNVTAADLERWHSHGYQATNYARVRLPCLRRDGVLVSTEEAVDRWRKRIDRERKQGRQATEFTEPGPT